MLEKKVVLENEEGMHARPAGVFVKTANQFSSTVEINFNGTKKNGKSVINLMSLGLKHKDEFLLMVNGPDESQAVQTLTTLIANKFSL